MTLHGPLDAPGGPGTVLPEPRPCQWCGQPALLAGARQRSKGEHPACRGWLSTLTDQAYWETVMSTAQALGAKIIEHRER